MGRARSRRREVRDYWRVDITSPRNMHLHWRCLLLRRGMPAVPEVVHQPKARARRSNPHHCKTCQRSPSSQSPRHASRLPLQQDWPSDTDCAAPARLLGNSVALRWQAWEASMAFSFPAAAQHRLTTQAHLNTRPPLPPQQPSLKPSSPQQ